MVLLTSAACAPSSAGSKYYKFTYSTRVGQLIPVNDRKPAQPFTAKLLNGGSLGLSSLHGQVVLINFWASWCGPCTIETPQFDLVYRSMKSEGVTFVGVDTKDEGDAARSFVKTNGISYPIVYDEPGKVAQILGNVPADLPYSMLIDKAGRVAAVYLGILSPKEIEPPLSELARSA